MIKRAIGFLILLILTAVGFLWPLAPALMPASSSPATDSVVITNYAATYAVDGGGLLNATETVTAKFPGGKHGIFRYWDVSDPSDRGVRYLPSVSSITLDGGSVPAQMGWEWQGGGRFYVAKIGDAGKYLTPGSHTYKITYSIPGVVSPISAGAGKEFVSAQGAPNGSPQSDFYWNVVAQGWDMAIQKADITISLPAAAEQVQCTAGVPAPGKGTGFVQGPCAITGAGTQQLALSAQNIPARSGMTVRAVMAPPPPSRTTVPWGVAWDRILGNSLGLVVLIVVATLVTGGIGLFFALRAREKTPGLPVMFGPPKGLGPAQTVFITEEVPGDHALTASLYYLADKQLVKLERRPDESWLVTAQGTPAEWAAIDPVTRGVAEDLGVSAPGFWFLADKTKEAGQILQTANNKVTRRATEWSENEGLVRTEAAEKVAKRIWVLCFVLAIGGFIAIIGPTMYGLPFAGFVLGGFGLMKTGVGMRRTSAGRRVWSEAGGFRRLLATDSSEARFDFSAKKDLFIAFIPFAVAFGVAAKWADKYKMATGEDPPWPLWYPYAAGSWYGAFGGSGGFDSFESALSSSIGAYQASQSSSGGGGGGGFGGGGGGGGGGSW